VTHDQGESIRVLLSTESGRAKLKKSLFPSLRRRLLEGITPKNIISTMIKTNEKHLTPEYVNRATVLVQEVLDEILSVG
jgi:hypothetical protein